jgi:membrane associated rhomboid family serine protease
LVLTNLLVYGVQSLEYRVYGSSRMETVLGLALPSLRDGAWWQIFTHAWLHSVELPLHLLVNMVLLRGVGPDLELQLGGRRFLAWYGLGIVTSALAFLIWDGGTGEYVVGASGAIFGLLLAFTSLNPTRRVTALLFFVIPLRMRARTLGRLAVVFELACLAFGWLAFVAHSAHLGGALVGWWLGTRERKRREVEYRKWLQREQEWRAQFGLLDGE